MRCLLSCPKKRYQYSLEITHSREINRQLEDVVRKYRRDAFEEDQFVKRHIVNGLPAELERLNGTPHQRSPQQTLRIARQNLADKVSREHDAHLMSGFLTLSVGIDATKQEQYFVDVEQIPVPFTVLQDETCYRLFRQMSDMRETFAGIDLRL